LSAHAGRTELIAFGARFKDRAENVLLVHGEPPALQSLEEGLKNEGCRNIRIQEEGHPIEI